MFGRKDRQDLAYSFFCDATFRKCWKEKFPVSLVFASRSQRSKETEGSGRKDGN